MDTGLAGKVALITGASRGIGAEIARLFAAEGTDLALLSRGGEDLERLGEELRSGYPSLQVHAATGDAAAPDCAERFVEEAVRRLGRVDVLVNNAGAGLRRPFDEVTEEDWSACLSLNLMAAVRFSRAVLPGMKSRREGRIINVAALSAARPRRGQIASNVAKAALVNFTKSLALEVAACNILVNAVAPGTVETPRWHAKFQRIAEEQGRPFEELVREAVAPAIPLARPGKPEEVAGLVVFLAGRQASYVTGATIEVDGGLGVGIALD